MQGDLVLDMSEKVIEFVLKLALNAQKLSDVEIDPSNTYVKHTHMLARTHAHTHNRARLSCMLLPLHSLCILNLFSVAVTGYCTIYLEGSQDKSPSHKGNYHITPPL